MRSKDILYKIVDVLLVLIIIAGYMGYKHYQRGSRYNLDTAVGAANDTSWKTYQNATFGYKFKYPNYLPVKADSDQPFGPYYGGPLSVGVIFGFEQKDRYDHFTEFVDVSIKNRNGECIKEQLLNSFGEYVFYVCTGQGGPYGLSALLKGPDRTITVGAGGECGLTAEFTRKSGCLKTVEDIRAFLSSFEFTTLGNEYNIAVWKSYSGHGFSFKYPEGWILTEFPDHVEFSHGADVIKVMAYNNPSNLNPFQFLANQKIISYMPTLIKGNYQLNNPGRADFSRANYGIFSMPGKFYVVSIEAKEASDPPGHGVFEQLLTTFSVQ